MSIPPPTSADVPPSVEITEQDVAEFQAIMKESYAVEPTPADAREWLTSLFRLYWLTTASPEPQPAAARSEPTAQHPMFVTLLELKVSLTPIEGRAQSWPWPVRVLTKLLGEALRTAISECRTRTTLPASDFLPLPEGDLTALLKRAESEVALSLTEEQRAAVKTLDRLNPETPYMTKALWDVVAIGLPAVFTAALTLVAQVCWKPGFLTWPGAEERERAQLVYQEVIGMLVLLRTL